MWNYDNICNRIQSGVRWAAKERRAICLKLKALCVNSRIHFLFFSGLYWKQSNLYIISSLLWVKCITEGSLSTLLSPVNATIMNQWFIHVTNIIRRSIHSMILIVWNILQAQIHKIGLRHRYMQQPATTLKSSWAVCGIHIGVALTHT